MRVDTHTAVLILRRIEDAAIPLVTGKIGEQPAVEQRVTRIMGWLGGLAVPLRSYLVDRDLEPPAPGPREWVRGGLLADDEVRP